MRGAHETRQIQQEASTWAMRQRMEPLDDALLDALEQWLAADPRHGEALADAEMAWEMAGQFKDAPMFASPVPKAGRSRWRDRFAWVWPLRASQWITALVLLALIGVGMEYDTVRLAWLADYRTSTGELRTLTLNDGSQILLGPRSALAVDYDGQQRRVRLLGGEALFTPAPRQADEQRPFVVESAGGHSEALGTRFLVQQADDGLVRVAVLQHQVRVSRGQSSLTLQQGKTARYTAGGEVHADAAEPQDVVAWTRGVLVFRGEPFEEVLNRLEAFHPGLLQVLDRQAAQRPVRGLFHLDNLDEALDRLAADMQLRRLKLAGVTLFY